MYRSEIRDSTFNDLLQKVDSHNYEKYLRKIRLNRIRGFRGVVVSLDFPVTALIGPNGGGKTTILGAAACAYKSVKPRQFFAKVGKLDDSMQNWQIEYELIDRTVNKNDVTQRTAKFKNYKWSREGLIREVAIFGVSRTIPASEWAGLSRWATSSLQIPDDKIESLSGPVIDAVGKVLGKDVSGFSYAQIDSAGKITLLSGLTKSGNTYSEFHFGAGESSVIRMVMSIEALPEQSLVLIEEIENGLHPIAVMRMVDYLIDMARRKRCQVVFTTHSNNALHVLPSKAIWAAMGDRAFQGKLDINSLRAITGQIEAQVAVFVEDAFAKIMVEASLRQHMENRMDEVEVYPMEGDSVAANMNQYHNEDPSAAYPSICIVDGDSNVEESNEERIYRLPGEQPESFIFFRVFEKFDEYGGELAVSLLQPYERTAVIQQKLDDVRLTNHDPHLIFDQLGKRLGFLPADTVKNAFANIWARAYPEEARTVIEPIEMLLDGDGR